MTLNELVFSKIIVHLYQHVGHCRQDENPANYNYQNNLATYG